MYFKFLRQNCGGKRPQSAEAALNQRLPRECAQQAEAPPVGKALRLCRQPKKALLSFDKRAFLEAPPRFELGNRGFAVLCLTTWLWRHITYAGDRPAYGFCGAGNEARTRYLHLGKVALYRMSYARIRPANCGVVPPVGVEPTTRGFSVRCSTY